METSSTSSNVPNIMSNTFVDKPDELVSSGTISQHHHQQQQQQQQQQKKCLHHRIFQSSIASNHVDQLTAVLLQQRQSNCPTESVQMQPAQQQVQQQPQPQQQHQHQQQQNQQQHQQQPQQQSVPYSRNFANALGGSAPMAVNNGNNASVISGNANSVAIIPNQNGLVQHMNATLLADRYLLLDMVDGSTLYKCMDVKTHEELVCKVANNPCTNLLLAHYRLSGHPHVNPLHQVIQGASQTYLFFKPSQGDLHSYVRVRKRLRETEAKRLFRQMCAVVKTCHEQGIVLRDLKLRKFVFADAERTHLRLESLEDAVVLDNPNEDLLQDKRGCPAYVSPEILRANTMYSGKAADMWSLGVILFTMLAGKYPFNDSEHASLFAKISRGQFLVPDCLTSKARCMIRSLLRREPEERILSEDILLHPWMMQEDNRDLGKSRGDQLVPDIFMDEDDV